MFEDNWLNRFRTSCGSNRSPPDIFIPISSSARIHKSFPTTAASVIDASCILVPTFTAAIHHTPLSPVEYRSTRPPSCLSPFLPFLFSSFIRSPRPTLFPPSEPRDGIVSRTGDRRTEIVGPTTSNNVIKSLPNEGGGRKEEGEREQFSRAKRR